jgi:predicted peptidase
MRNLASYLASIVALVAMHRVALAESLAFIYDDGQGNTMPYRLFLPPDHTPETEYPLVLYMHGAGERGTDNMRQLNNIESLIAATQSDRFASYLLAPQAPVDLGWSSELGVNLTAGVLDEMIANYSVDSTRIYATGFSAGGTGTFAQVHDSELFAAGVPIAAGLNGVTPELAEELAPGYRDMPLWVFHGSLDTFWPAEKARLLVDAIRAVGGSPLYTEFPDRGHGIRMHVYEDVNDELYAWMFSQQLIPEPATWVLIGWGVALTGLFRQQKKLR